VFGTSSLPKRLNYEPGLDGLRALAIILVVIYHDGIGRSLVREKLPGGYIGVDVFFVLSGFLITSILLLERASTGKPISGQFWIRRVRRLFPAIVIAVLATALYAVIFAPASDASAIRGQGLATLFYVQNWYVQGSPVLTPLSHATTLSIEEQWYVVWPFLLAGLLFLTRGRRVWLLVGVLTLAAVSYAEMTFMYSLSTWARIYNSTDTRAWELLAGAALAVVMLGRAPVRRAAGRVALEVAGIAGLGYLIWAAFNLHSWGADSWQYTRGGLLLVILSVVALIAAVVQPRSPVLRPMFSWRPLVALGLISYGVYLYHLGIFMVMSESRTGMSGNALTLVRWIVTLGVATLSYLLVEQPIRRGVSWTRPKVALGGVAVVAAIVVLLVSTTAPAPSTFAAQTSSSDAPRVLVAGDDLAYALALVESPPPIHIGGIQGLAVANSGCGIAGGTALVQGSKLPNVQCSSNWPSMFSSAVKMFHPDVSVLMVGQRTGFDRKIHGKVLRTGTPELEHYLEDQLDRARSVLTANGASMVLTTVPCLDPGPQVPADYATALADRARTRWLDEVFSDYAHAHPGVKIADLGSVLCPHGSAHVVEAGAELRPDGVSLSANGGRFVWSWVARVAIATQRHASAARAGTVAP
jgi:peptidoglycan/LPS O-acetylase OafA/YrhL